MDPKQLSMFADLPDFVEEPEEFEEDADGNVLIPEGAIPEEIPQQFDDNLAEFMPAHELAEMASTIIELVDIDIKARAKRDKQYAEGIKRTGMGGDAPGGADFTGASRVVHPVIAESCVDFAARAIKELFPANGPVKVQSQEGLTMEMERLSQHRMNFMNHYLVHGIKEYRDVKEVCYTQLPLGGSQYQKFWWCPKEQRVKTEFIPIDDLILPYGAASFLAATRFTHRFQLTEQDYKERVKSGLYRDLSLSPNVFADEKSESATAAAKIEGKEDPDTNELMTFYDVYMSTEVEYDQLSGGEYSPYIVTIDKDSEEIVAVHRNWQPEDPLRQKLDWIIEDKFIPWRGAQGVGLFHLIGSLAAGATGALRALLDSAHINNLPTLMKMKGSRLNSQSMTAEITKIMEVEGPVGADDVRKILMPVPFNPPSPVLFQLLGWLTQAAQGVVSTASEKMADATSNTPVGTTQALIEQGAVIFSSIHGRLHASQMRAFEVIVRILKTYAPPEITQQYGFPLEQLDMKGLTLVSDPHIFSETQRFAQFQGMMQLIQTAPPGMYSPDAMLEVHRRGLQLMRIPDVDRLLPIPQPPQPVDPAQEIVNLVTGAPAPVVPDQDHESHIEAHLNWLIDPMFGRNMLFVPHLQGLLDHLKLHTVHWYNQNIQKMVNQAAQQLMVINPESPPPVDTLIGSMSDEMLMFNPELAERIATTVDETMAFIRQTTDIMTPINLDPTVAATKMMADTTMAETLRKAKKDAADIALKTTEIESRVAENMAQAQAAAEEIRIKEEKAIRDAEVEIVKNREDNMIEWGIAKAQMQNDRTLAAMPVTGGLSDD